MKYLNDYNVLSYSFEVGVRVEAYRYENGCIGPMRHINSAFLTYDLTASAKTCLPRYIPETEVKLIKGNVYKT